MLINDDAGSEGTCYVMFESWAHLIYLEQFLLKTGK